MTVIKHCPFCGCEAVAFVTHINHYHGVSCMGCTARIYGYSTRELAVEAWNRRAEDG